MQTRLSVSPGSIVVVRDEEWLVTQTRMTDDGQLITVQGVSDLVRGTTASFYESLDEIEVLDPRRTTLRADASPHYRDARLWLEATVRKTPLPLTNDDLTVSREALADPLSYQHSAVKRALSPESLRPRILLADAVGLGKTLEIGMILSELIRRGRGERILIVCPRHVLEQMQNEMWSRFAIPFVRLDSLGVQRVKQKLPATRNPFTYFNRVIISMDTLKQDRFSSDLRKHQWDAVVIDESHNVTNSSTQNNRLARTLAPNTDALILASATPHNGHTESFAELVRLLEPTAVTPEGQLIPDEVKRLVVRRHRNSDDVASVVGADWAERKKPEHKLISASPAEDAVASELADVWLHPKGGVSPYSGQVSTLFPWTLAKAFLSSPAALDATIRQRLKTLGSLTTPAQRKEADALTQLARLNDATEADSSKYDALLAYLKCIGVGKSCTQRAVVFSERVSTLRYLQRRLMADFGFSAGQVRVLHGGLTDLEQQEIVESFKQSTSPIRVLVTGDIASEGVNLHKQCHELIHYDIPWSLIRIEQRNGRIDRYGQKTSPQITTLLLNPSAADFAGDLTVLTRLLQKEEEAHTALGDAASLMGQYSVEKEEEAIKRVLAGRTSLEDTVKDAAEVATLGDPLAALFAQLNVSATVSSRYSTAQAAQPGTGLYTNRVDFLREALTAAFIIPEAEPSANGVSWLEHPDERLVEFVPPPDLRQRLEVLPQGYLADRRVLERLLLTPDKGTGKQLLERALTDDSDSSWPEAHYLGPLHPVLDWAADRALASLSRNQVYVVRGSVDAPTMLLIGTLTNRRGQTVAASWVQVRFPNPDEPSFALTQVVESPRELFTSVGFGKDMYNPGPAAHIDRLVPLVAHAVDSASSQLDAVLAAATQAAEQRIRAWSERTLDWQEQANRLAQRLDLKQHSLSVTEEDRLIRENAPTQRLVRPLLMVVPADHASDFSEGA